MPIQSKFPRDSHEDYLASGRHAKKKHQSNSFSMEESFNLIETDNLLIGTLALQ